MIAGINARRSGGAAQPWLYFALVQILSIPFYWGVLTPLRGFPFYGWPVAVAVILVPATVATVLTAREQGGHAALHLWSRIGDVRRIRGARWVLFALLMPPAVAFVAYGIVRYFHLALPAVVRFTPAAAPGYFASFFIGAIPEEIGWTGYATEPLQRRYGVIRAGLIIGGFWALWHVAMWWVGGGWEGQDHLVATVSQAVSIVLFRVVMGWIYANGGRSLFLAILIHAVDNTCWKLFPNDGSHYNPTAMAAVMVIVTMPIIMFVKARREAG